MMEMLDNLQKFTTSILSPKQLIGWLKTCSLSLYHQRWTILSYSYIDNDFFKGKDKHITTLAIEWYLLAWSILIWSWNLSECHATLKVVINLENCHFELRKALICIGDVNYCESNTNHCKNVNDNPHHPLMLSGWRYSLIWWFPLSLVCRVMTASNGTRCAPYGCAFMIYIIKKIKPRVMWRILSFQRLGHGLHSNECIILGCCSFNV